MTKRPGVGPLPDSRMLMMVLLAPVAAPDLSELLEVSKASTSSKNTIVLSPCFLRPAKMSKKRTIFFSLSPIYLSRTEKERKIIN